MPKHEVSWDQVFTQIVEEQLSKPLQERWIRHVSALIEKDEAVSFQRLIDFLTTELAALEAIRGKDESRKTDFRKSNTSKKQKQLGPFSAQVS